MLKLGWFSTGRGEGSRNLLSTTLEHVQSGYINADIQYVFCNREPGEFKGSDRFHSLVKASNVPLITLSSRRLVKERGASGFNEVREAFDSEAIKLLDPFEIDLAVLAGYMLFTSELMCQKLSMINLHPAPPNGPVGSWREVIWELIEQKAPQGGVQIQLATMDWDRGPVITYCTFPLRGPLFDEGWELANSQSIDELRSCQGEEFQLFQQIRDESTKREIPLLIETLKALGDGELKVTDGRVVDKEHRPITGLCLNSQIDKWLS